MSQTKTAIVLIEYQNDFTSEGGVLHEAVKPVMQSTGMLGNTVAAVAKARELGALIVHAPITFTPDYHELSPTPYGILKGVVDSGAFRKGSWGAEIVDLLAPQEQDIVVEGKRGLDAFATTNLDFILRARGIEKIAIGGFLTNCCVESTMRTGYEKGFDVVTLVDCTATVSQEEQASAIQKNFPMFSRPMPYGAFLSELENKLSGSFLKKRTKKLLLLRGGACGGAVATRIVPVKKVFLLLFVHKKKSSFLYLDRHPRSAPCCRKA